MSDGYNLKIGDYICVESQNVCGYVKTMYKGGVEVELPKANFGMSLPAETGDISMVIPGKDLREFDAMTKCLDQNEKRFDFFADAHLYCEKLIRSK